MTGDGYSGKRFLLDTQSTRQFSVTFVDGRPDAHIETVGGAFKAGETIFALDDEADFSVRDGVARASTTLYQMTVDRAGRPSNLKLLGVSFDITLRAGPPHFTMEARLDENSVKALYRMGFARDFPQVFTQRADSSSKNFKRTPGGYIADPSFFDNVCLLPQHGARASSARTGVVMALPKVVYPDTHFIDAQTVSIIKELENGKLQTVFNFETQRVTEVFTGTDGKQAAMSGFAFRDYGDTALKLAFDRLKSLGGNPRDYDESFDKKFGVKLPQPKP